MKGFIIRNKYRVVSVSGTYCELNCFYCGARYLKGMEPLTPEQLYKYIVNAYNEGARGFLISGGSDEQGKLLHIDRVLPVLKEVRRVYSDIVFSIHAGLVDRRIIEEMSSIVDVVDYEFAYTRKTFHYKGLRRVTRDKYVEVLENLISRGPPYIVPHLMIVPGDEDLDDAVKIAASYKPYLLTYLVLIPPRGVRLNAAIDYVVEKIKHGSALFNGKIALGCMRPAYIKQELDKRVVELGIVERIANPHPTVLSMVKEIYDACCSIPEKYLYMFSFEENPWELKTPGLACTSSYSLEAKN